MDEPSASTIQFEEPDPDAPGGPWQLGIVVTGTGFQSRGLPLLASVGSVVIQYISTFPDDSGFSGYLASTPNDGDALTLGFAEQNLTELVYHPGTVA